MSDSNCAKELANDVFNTFCARVLKTQNFMGSIALLLPKFSYRHYIV